MGDFIMSMIQSSDFRTNLIGIALLLYLAWRGGYHIFGKKKKDKCDACDIKKEVVELKDKVLSDDIFHDQIDILKRMSQIIRRECLEYYREKAALYKDRDPIMAEVWDHDYEKNLDLALETVGLEQLYVFARRNHWHEMKDDAFRLLATKRNEIIIGNVLESMRTRFAPNAVPSHQNLLENNEALIMKVSKIMMDHEDECRAFSIATREQLKEKSEGNV